MNSRQETLLKEIVESYIKTVKPVGSKSLCEKLKCSSATIRNEMAELEELGLLEKNHISSGRIPSEDGYRYYVEHLMRPKELTGEDVLKLQTIFTNRDLVLSDTITKCVEIISEITNYTSVALGKKSHTNALQQVSIIPLKEDKIVALVCTDQGIVQNRQFTIPSSVKMEELVKTSEIINKMLVGTPIDEVSERLEFDVKPIISKRIEQYESVYHIFMEAFQNFATNVQENIHLSGKYKLIEKPEYNDVDEIRKIASKFEDVNLIKKIEEKKSSKGINIYIGEENEFDPNVTVIKTTYHINGEEGTIAIIGPKRMEYDRVVGLLSYINENLNDERE
ncbi:MAG: heat-inducible transcription repressor HrcA [Bacilli bacterium]|nr:heat-inducible transcription repressor HrcA [Bacilli bacterium]